MILIEDNCKENLDLIAQEHFQNLISPINQDGTFHITQSLIGRIQEQLKNDLYLKDRVNFWNYLLRNNYENLQKIITAKPDILATIIDDIGIQFGHGIFSNNISYRTASLTEFGRIVKRVFGYDNYRDNGRAVSNTAKLNVNYCPYCNQQKTQTIENTDTMTGVQRMVALFQLDHFYPQSRFPFLGVSFFNMIPGCSPCNAHLKGEKDFNITTHFNPFHKRFNDYFKFKLTQIVFTKFDEVETKIENIKLHESNAIVDFSLVQRYNDSDCKRTAFNLIAACKNRSSVVKRTYAMQIRGLFGSLEVTNKALMKSQGVPLNPNEINDFQMGKFKRDICLQLRIL